ncbi:MAG: type II toxin-antitoxin system VapC family toxin [Acidobacteria bacterium]|nr:type II toxin-antitoxin system VapC family toxin [Acidobacteriota bacterium]
MTCLLDTHCFLWAILNDPRLSAPASHILRDGRNHLFLSVASVWEIMVKVEIGRLPLPRPAADFMLSRIVSSGVQMLPIRLEHALRLEGLPMHHRDPFDRMLVAQAMEEDVPILSADPALRAYGAEIIW